MSNESRRIAGSLLVVLPTVMTSGISLLSMLLWEPAYAANPLPQNLWRAGHAHSGVLLVLSLVVLRYVDEAHLSEPAKNFLRLATRSAAILFAGWVFSFGANASSPGIEGINLSGVCWSSCSSCRSNHFGRGTVSRDGNAT